MFNDFYPMTFALFLILGSWGLTLAGRSLRDKSRMREREMIHQERMLAMQSGKETPGASSATALPTSDPSHAARWFRMVALGIGLFLLFAGVGMCLAFSIATAFFEIWPIGIIPALGGIGFLLFYGLSARIERDFAQAKKAS